MISDPLLIADIRREALSGCTSIEASCRLLISWKTLAQTAKAAGIGFPDLQPAANDLAPAPAAVRSEASDVADDQPRPEEAAPQKAWWPGNRSSRVGRKPSAKEYGMPADLERQLIVRWKEQGCRQSRDRILACHEPMLRARANRAAALSGGKFGLDDLLQEARLAAVEAIETYDPNHSSQARFSTHLEYRIHGAIGRYQMDNHGQMRVGTNFSDKKVFWRYRKERAEIEGRTGRPLDDAGRATIAKRIGVPLSVVKRMEPRVLNQDISFDNGYYEPGGFRGDGDTSDAMDNFRDVRKRLVSPPLDEDVIRAADTARYMEALTSFLDDLGEREQTILKGRFFSETRVQLDELGEQLGRTKERARQLERSALRALRQKLEERSLVREDAPFEAA